MRRALEALLSQPHRPFFLLAFFDAIVFMLLFYGAYRLGFWRIDAKLWHGWSMLFGLFLNLFYGFSYTVFPRFCARPPVAPAIWIRVWLLEVAASAAMLLWPLIPQAFIAASLLTLLSLSLTIRTFLSLFRDAAQRGQDQYWIIVAYGMAFVSALLLLLSVVPCHGCDARVFASYGIETGVYLYLFLLPIVVAFRMVPIFSAATRYRREAVFYPLVAASLLAHVVLSQSFAKLLFLADLFLALYLLRELLRMDPRCDGECDGLLRSLHLALYWLPTAFLASAMAEFFQGWFGWVSLHLPLHLVALGFLATLMIGFVTRVTLGHSGMALRMGRGGRALVWAVQAAALSRMVFSLTASTGASSALLWFDLSVALWLLVVGGWLWLYGRRLFAAPV